MYNDLTSIENTNHTKHMIQSNSTSQSNIIQYDHHYHKLPSTMMECPTSPQSYATTPLLYDTKSYIQGNKQYHNPVITSFIRDNWIRQQLELQRSAFTGSQRTKVVTGTWNVNGKKPLSSYEASSILQWLGLHPNEDPLQAPDIIAFGFQEIVDLNAVNVMVQNLSIQRSSQWTEVISYALNQIYSNGNYKVILEKHLVGILLIVFVQKKHMDNVRAIQGATAGVGLMGMMGNKGGTAVRLQYYESTICFVCAHLAAHRMNVTGRNADYLNILSKIEFEANPLGVPAPPTNCVFPPSNPQSSTFQASQSSRNTDVSTNDSGFSSNTMSPPILKHDFVFWLGDLNYRISEEILTEKCFYSAIHGPIDQLLQYDQLNIERKNGNVFQGFEEGLITFSPTYKYQVGTSIYEQRPDKKLRAPAWCDRVLWKALDPRSVALESYNSVLELNLSDHKPVVAHFHVQVQHVVESKKLSVLREVITQLDKYENDTMPKVRLLHEPVPSRSKDDSMQATVSASHSGVIAFPSLRYGREMSRVVIIENIGPVVAHFRFIPKLDDIHICKPWLRISPVFGMVLPKAKLSIHLSAYVDRSTANAIASGTETLDDTMILRIENGRDYFLVVSGKYENSCFGTSVEHLVDIWEPVRKVNTSLTVNAQNNKAHNQLYHPKNANDKALIDVKPQNGYHCTTDRDIHAHDAQSPATHQKLNSHPETNHEQKIPKELWRMVDDIYTSHMDVKNLFVEAGDPLEISVLRECLDTGRKFPDNHLGLSTAELLLRWLQSLSESIVPDNVLVHSFGPFYDEYVVSGKEVTNYRNDMAIITSSQLPTSIESHNSNEMYKPTIKQVAARLLDQLSTVKYNILIYLLAFLREVLKHSLQNKLTIEKLAYVFSRCLVAGPPIKRQDDYSHYSSGSATSSIGSTATDSSSASSIELSETNLLPEISIYQSCMQPPTYPEEMLRRNAKEMEEKELEALKRFEQMNKLLLYWLADSGA